MKLKATVLAAIVFVGSLTAATSAFDPDIAAMSGLQLRQYAQKLRNASAGSAPSIGGTIVAEGSRSLAPASAFDDATGSAAAALPQQPVSAGDSALEASVEASMEHRSEKYPKEVRKTLKERISLATYEELLTKKTTEHAVGRFTDGLVKFTGEATVLVGVKNPLPENNYKPGGFKDSAQNSVKYFGRYIKMDISNFVKAQHDGLLRTVVDSNDERQRYAAHRVVVAAMRDEVEARVKAYFTDPATNVIDASVGLQITGNQLAQTLADTVERCLLDDVGEHLMSARLRAQSVSRGASTASSSAVLSNAQSPSPVRP